MIKKSDPAKILLARPSSKPMKAPIRWGKEADNFSIACSSECSPLPKMAKVASVCSINFGRISTSKSKPFWSYNLETTPKSGNSGLSCIFNSFNKAFLQAFLPAWGDVGIIGWGRAVSFWGSQPASSIPFNIPIKSAPRYCKLDSNPHPYSGVRISRA